MARKPLKNQIQPTLDAPNGRSGELRSFVQTLGTTSQVVAISVPTWARVCRFYPNSTGLQWAIDEDPVTSAASAYAASITGSSAGGVGVKARAGEWTEVRFDDGSGGSVFPATLRMLAATNSSTVDINFYG